MLLVALSGCSGPAEPVAVIELPPPQSIPMPPATASAEGGAARVELQTISISPLFRGFFGDPRFTKALQDDLGACVDGLTVVQVSYNEAERIGFLRLVVEEPGFRCQPTVGGGRVDLSPLAPAAAALARYRDAVSGSYDIRIRSFRIMIEGRNSKAMCVLRAAGQHPPDGSTFSPCVELNGHETCLGDRMDGVDALTLPAQQAALFNRCFSGR